MKKVIVVGATGLVGETIRNILEEREFPISEVKFLASSRSAGKEILFNGKSHVVKALSGDEFDGFDIAFFAAGSDVSKEYVPIAAEKGVRVVDNSSYFRMDENVPLVVPEVNPEAIKESDYIIANPNCSTIQCMAPLFQINKHYGIKRVVFSTYQSVSGSGVKGLKDLDEGIQEFYPFPIKGNVIPHIDSFLENGYTKEEMKMINETRKILGIDDLKVTATTVRVPVRFAHSVSINVETEKDFSVDDVKELMDCKLGMKLMDDVSNLVYPLPIFAEGKDEILIGRIRRDESLEHGLNLWSVADNIRKGAALNAVQIGELLLRS
ncbi:MAG: aspartate-semialdehyde dehydrogenase [Tissierellia bacterium]|nr:aspartate-semialdehyde dehydrogenase [Tissierellia bacterium]